MAEFNQKSMAIPLLDDFDTWEEYEDCICLWELSTKIDKKERGAVLSMTIPIDSTKFGEKLRKGMFKVVKPRTLAENEHGVKLIMDYFRQKLATNETEHRI